MSAPVRTLDTALIDDAHRTSERLDAVATELASLVTELRSLVDKLAEQDPRDG